MQKDININIKVPCYREGIHKNNSNLLLSSMESSKNQVGQFKLGKTLGQGTFGKVKLGTHIITGEKVLENLKLY
jgi:hypothetical protein